MRDIPDDTAAARRLIFIYRWCVFVIHCNNRKCEYNIDGERCSRSTIYYIDRLCMTFRRMPGAAELMRQPFSARCRKVRGKYCSDHGSLIKWGFFVICSFHVYKFLKIVGSSDEKKSPRWLVAQKNSRFLEFYWLIYYLRSWQCWMHCISDLCATKIC